MWLIDRFLTLPSRIKAWLAGLAGFGAVLLGLKAYIWKSKKDAVEDYKDEKVLKDVKVRKDAKKVGIKEKRDASRLSDGDLTDRLRRRSADWDRL